MTGWLVVALLIIAIAAIMLVSGFVPIWRRYHGKRLITCPENLQPAAVDVDAVHAAKWAAVSGETPLRLSSCSRWPEMGGCGQECLSQIESSPDSCRVQTIVTNWYGGKSCHYCGHRIEQIVWHERPPALRRPDGTSVEWKDVRPEELPYAFATYDAVCWPCHIRESFRVEHRELVIDRQRLAEPKHAIEPSAGVY